MHLIKGIYDKNTVLPKHFLMVFRDEMIDYKGDSPLIKTSVVVLWQGEIFNLEDVIWMNRGVQQHSPLFASVD